MFDYLETLRQKPPHVRRQIAFGVTVVVFLAVIGMWVTLSDVRVPDTVAEGHDRGAPAPPLETVKELFSSTFSKMKEAKEIFDVNMERLR